MAVHTERRYFGFEHICLSDALGALSHVVWLIHCSIDSDADREDRSLTDQESNKLDIVSICLLFLLLWNLGTAILEHLATSTMEVDRGVR